MASLKSAMKSGQKNHRERSQISSRKHLGLLEKHKDYVVRAKNFHQKQSLLKRLKRKAVEKNPDEFYFKMVSQKTQEGVHILQNKDKKTYTQEEMKLLKTQDMNYLNYKFNSEGKKVERMQANLHMIDIVDMQQKKHVFFFDNKKDFRAFDPVKQFDTTPELLSRTHNIPSREMLQNPSFKTTTRQSEKQYKVSYKELEQRIKRESTLSHSREALALQRGLMGNGTVYKRKSKGSKPIFKWKKQRKH